MIYASAYEGTGIITSKASNKVLPAGQVLITSKASNKVLPAGQVLISYCDEGAIYHAAKPYIISRSDISLTGTPNFFYNIFRVIKNV